MASENKPTVLVTGEKSLLYCSFVKNLASSVASDNFSGISTFKAIVIFLSVYMHDKEEPWRLSVRGLQYLPRMLQCTFPLTS